MPLDIRPLRLPQDRDAFIDVLWRVYADDPVWVPPLRWILRGQLHPRQAPFLRYGRAQLFLAQRNGRAVGRISAHINPRHDAYHGERAGFFGFFECLDDPEAAAALFAAAEAWLRDQGAAFARGPLSFTINEEAGTLVDGFEYPPVIDEPHGRPYYDRLIRDCGYAKAKDLLALEYPLQRMDPRLSRARLRLLALPSVRIRPFQRLHLQRDVRIALEIFNDAWHDNWGFVPVSRAEADHLARDLLPVADPRVTAIAEVDGEPVAMVVGVPNVNEAIRDLNGRLLPFGWAKMLWRLRRGTRTGRVMLLGVHHKGRTRALAGLAIALLAEIHLRSRERRYEWVELSWVLEDNHLLLSMLRRLGARAYKRYRIYEKPLHPTASAPGEARRALPRGAAVVSTPGPP